MSLLFSPFRIRNTIFKNRMGLSPMCMYSSIDGFATDFHLVHLGSRALGGFGLVIQEATAISPEGRITYQDLGIWKDEHILKLKEVVDFCHSHGALVGIQLAHAGRKASSLPPHLGRKKVKPHEKNGWQTVSASPLPYHLEDTPPHELNEKGIQKIKEDFLAATQRAKVAGYDVLEIHAAHGYLLHQFYSPLSNQRQDHYGGSFENRIRLLLEIVVLIKKEWGAEKPLFVRISATDWVDGGWDIEDSIRLAQKLKHLGVDLIDTSSGGNYRVKINTFPSYQVDFAQTIKEKAEIATAAVGLITQAKVSEELLQAGKANLILYGRAALRHPYLPLHFAHQLQDDIKWPIQYSRGKEERELDKVFK